MKAACEKRYFEQQDFVICLVKLIYHDAIGIVLSMFEKVKFYMRAITLYVIAPTALNRQQNRRVGTASSCPRVTVEKGEKDKAQGEIFVGKPRNPRGHKIVPTLPGYNLNLVNTELI